MLKFSSFILILFIIPVSLFAQKGVEGVFRYKAEISYQDTNLVMKAWDVTIYTNDTIVRSESSTAALGNQVYIRHMGLNKAYLLLEFNNEKFAIQTNLDENRTTEADSTAKSYTIKKKMFGGKKVAGIKTKRYHIEDKANNKSFDAWFAKKIPNKYLEVYPEVKGLALDYMLPSQDGWIHYTLTEFKEGPVSRDIFGVPSDYKRVTFEEFVNTYSGN